MPDLGAAERFYAGRLGLAAARMADSLIQLSGGGRLYLEAVAPMPGPAPDQARAFATFLVRDIENLPLGGDDIDTTTRKPELVRAGLCIRFRDPFGNVHTFLEPREAMAFDVPRLHSAGIKIPIASVPAAKRLYADTLGFAVQSERYYPPLLPMNHADGSPAFTIEDKEIWEPDVRVRAPVYPAETGAVLVFQSQDLADHRAALTRRAPNLRLTPVESFALGKRMAFLDAAGLASEIWQLA